MTGRIDRELDDARARLRRLSAREVPDALERGALLVDIRPQAQRDREGGVTGRAGDRTQCAGVALRPDQ
jgi:hypothetical protein